MKLIPLTKGLFAKVDDEDFDKLNKYKWKAQHSGAKYYASRSLPRINGQTRKIIYMHREVMSAIDEYVDHRDNDGLNNTRSNLRKCSQTQNNANSKRHGGKIGLKGVTFDSRRPGRFIAQLTHNYRVYKLGVYSTPEEAHCAYLLKAKEIYGDFANAG